MSENRWDYGTRLVAIADIKMGNSSNIWVIEKGSTGVFCKGTYGDGVTLELENDRFVYIERKHWRAAENTKSPA